METIKIRAHHLELDLEGTKTARENLVRTLIRDGYIDSGDDSFVSRSYDRLREILRSPNQTLEITADAPDFICNACRKPSRGECNLYEPLNSNVVGRVFLDNLKSKDQEVAEEYSLQIGKTYTVREVLRHILISEIQDKMIAIPMFPPRD